MIFRRVAYALVLVPLFLAGCTSSTGGSGTATSGSAGTSAPAAPSASTPSSASSSSPTSSAAPHPVPPGRYARTAVAMPYGDPVLVDWCASLGTDFAKSAGLTPEAGGLQFVPGCGYEFKKGTTTELNLEMIVEGPSIQSQPHPPIQQTTHVGNVTVEKFGLASGICPRLVEAGPIDMIVEAIHGSAPETSPLLCQFADAGVARFAQVNAMTSLPKLALPTPSYTDVDLCKVARATSTAPIPKFGSPKYSVMSLGATCSVQSAQYIYTLSVARVPDVLAYALYKTVRVRSHTLQASNDNTHLKCDIDDIGPKVPGTENTHEVLDITLNAHYGSAQLCGQVASFMGNLLDTAGIK